MRTTRGRAVVGELSFSPHFARVLGSKVGSLAGELVNVAGLEVVDALPQPLKLGDACIDTITCHAQALRQMRPHGVVELLLAGVQEAPAAPRGSTPWGHLYE